jgi:hypothetical protein
MDIVSSESWKAFLPSTGTKSADETSIRLFSLRRQCMDIVFAGIVIGLFILSRLFVELAGLV